MDGWQSESTDGPEGGWSCAFWSGCIGCSGHLTHNSWMQRGVAQQLYVVVVVVVVVVGVDVVVVVVVVVVVWLKCS